MRSISFLLLAASLASCNDNTHTELPTTEAPLVKDSAGQTLEEYRKPFITSYRFDSFKATVYKGKLLAPTKGDNELIRDSAFMSPLRKACGDSGINFAGHYTVVQSGCGAMCSGLYIIDRITGQIYADLPPNNGGRWGFLYKPDSRMLISNANALDDSLKTYMGEFDAPEIYEWTGTSLKQLQ
ncbi:MAG: hypothetical protein J7578_10005 [Chitinophagaceae bacterium]|nr:hypothetical protein [Chitinophagaceae bacterium]